MKELNFSIQVISLEIRRVFSYRVDFWVNFFLGTFTRLALSYFLWEAVYSSSGQEQIAGLTKDMAILYTVLAFLVDQVVRSGTLKAGVISREIYDGSLTRYLVYPTRLFVYKLSIMLTQAVVGVTQFVLGFATYCLIFGFPAAPAFEPIRILQAVTLLALATLCFFILGFVIEMVAFWADNVWSLNVMLRFVSAFFGGAFIPIEMFPESVQRVVSVLPFWHMIGRPSGLLMGTVNTSAFVFSAAVLVVWIFVFSFMYKIVWAKGLRNFTGVGM